MYALYALMGILVIVLIFTGAAYVTNEMLDREEGDY